jgi:hypothetical protein
LNRHRRGSLGACGGAEHIERVDSLTRRIARQQGLQSDALDEIVTWVDERLAMNCAGGGAKRP